MAIVAAASRGASIRCNSWGVAGRRAVMRIRRSTPGSVCDGYLSVQWRRWVPRWCHDHTGRIPWRQPSFVLDENGLDRIDRTDVVPLFATVDHRRLIQTAVVAFHRPMLPQYRPAVDIPDCVGLEAHRFGQQTAYTSIAMLEHAIPPTLL